MYGNTRVPVRSQGRERLKSDQKSINSQKYKNNGFQRTSYILTICNFTKYWKRQKKEPIFFSERWWRQNFWEFRYRQLLLLLRISQKERRRISIKSNQQYHHKKKIRAKNKNGYFLSFFFFSRVSKIQKGEKISSFRKWDGIFFPKLFLRLLTELFLGET